MKIRTDHPINKGDIYTRNQAFIVTANGMDDQGFWFEKEPLATAYRKLEKRLAVAERHKGDTIEALQYEIQRLRTSYPVSRIRELEAELDAKQSVLDAIREALT